MRPISCRSVIWLVCSLTMGCLPLPDDSARLGEEGPPELTPATPDRASLVPDGETQVSGIAIGMDTLTINGSDVSPSSGLYSTELDLARGLNTLDLVGLDLSSVEHEVLYSVLAGTFEPTDGGAAGAVQVHAGADALQALGGILGELADPQALLDQIGTAGTVLFDDGNIVVELTGISLDDVQVQLTPTPGSLELSFDLVGLVAELAIEGSVIGFPAGVDGSLTIDDASLRSTLEIDTDTSGGLLVDLSPPELVFSTVELDVNGIADAIEDLFLSDEDVQTLLEDQVGLLTADLPAQVDQAVADLLAVLRVETEVLGTPVTLEPFFSSAGVTAGGLDLGVDLALAIGDGAPAQYLVSASPPPPTGDELSLVIADDLVNRALAQLLAAGVLDLELPLAAGSVEASLLALVGGDPSEGGTLALDAGMAPVLIGQGGLARVQAGEWVVAIDTPGGAYGDRVEVVMHADVGAAFTLTDEALGVTLDDAQVRLAPVEPNPALQVALPQIEQAVAAALGLLNGLLVVPLDTLLASAGGSADGLVLPPLGLSRDASDLGTRLDATLTGWDPGVSVP